MAEATDMSTIPGRTDRHVRSSTGRRRRARPVMMAAAVLVVVAGACAPAVAPPPTIAPQPEGSGRVPDVTVAPSSGCASSSQLSPGRASLTVEFGGVTRRARMLVPARAADAPPMPVLLSLHPFSVDAAGWEQYSGLAAAAAARGYLVISPNGSHPGPRWAVPGGLDTGADDIGYLGALLDEAERIACVDRNREFAAGFSAGAAMSQALSCTLPWRMAAVAASGGANLTDLCPDSPPTDVLVLHGSADPIAPTTGSQVIFAPPLGLDVDDVVATNAHRAGCNPVPTVEQAAPSVRIDRHVDCADDHRVEYWRLLGAGHTWAGAPNALLELVTGPTNTDVSANDAILDFFDAT